MSWIIRLLLYSLIERCQIAGVLLLSTQVASLIVWASSDDTRTTTGIASRAVSCLASLCILATLYTEHFYSPRPSLLLGLYLVITLLFDIVKIRSAFLRDAVSDGSLAIGAIGLRFVLIILEEIPKRSLFISHEKQVSANKESTGGFCSRAVFVWLFPLFHLGYNTRITVEDLDELSEDMQVSRLDDCFREHWDKGKSAPIYWEAYSNTYVYIRQKTRHRSMHCSRLFCSPSAFADFFYLLH